MLAIIALSDGSLDALSHFSDRALSDWRDVLYRHEHPRGEDEPKSWAEFQAPLGIRIKGVCPEDYVQVSSGSDATKHDWGLDVGDLRERTAFWLLV